MTFEEKRVIKDRITAVVEEEIDRIANDRSVSSSAKKTVLEALEANARALAACVLAGMEIPTENWAELRGHAEFEIKYNTRDHLIQMAF